jgi:hypothetical protein
MTLAPASVVEARGLALAHFGDAVLVVACVRESSLFLVLLASGSSASEDTALTCR